MALPIRFFVLGYEINLALVFAFKDTVAPFWINSRILDSKAFKLVTKKDLLSVPSREKTIILYGKFQPTFLKKVKLLYLIN